MLLLPPTQVRTSGESCVAEFPPPSSRWNRRLGGCWPLGGDAWTKITRSSEPTMPQLLATFTAVKMLSPGEKEPDNMPCTRFFVTY